MKNKKLGMALLTVAIFTNAYARQDRKVYQPKSPWPLVVVEDVVVGTAGVLTLGQTDANPTALPMAIPDAIPGVSYARTKDTSDESCPKKMKKECKTKKEKSCKKTCDSTKKTTRKEKADNAGKVVTAPVVVPAAVVADVVTLDTQHFTTRAVDSINGDSEEKSE